MGLVTQIEQNREEEEESRDEKKGKFFWSFFSAEEAALPFSNNTIFLTSYISLITDPLLTLGIQNEDLTLLLLHASLVRI